MKDIELRREIVGICRVAHAQGLVVAADGNLSARTARGTILITPSGTSKHRLKAADLLEIDNEGNLLGGAGRPSSEVMLHLFTYRMRPDARAVVHLHPCVSTALTIAGLRIREGMAPRETLTGLGRIALVKYAKPGSPALARLTSNALRNANGVLLARHGSVTVGKDIQEAYSRAEKMEQLAMMTLVSRIAILRRQ